ncbi:MAG: hypothetical protein KIT07_04585, partial [Anaerolineales bacterium]|nr:hypothetical protein [Anaerolineales bacterium]
AFTPTFGDLLQCVLQGVIFFFAHRRLYNPQGVYQFRAGGVGAPSGWFSRPARGVFGSACRNAAAHNVPSCPSLACTSVVLLLGGKMQRETNLLDYFLCGLLYYLGFASGLISAF